MTTINTKASSETSAEILTRPFKNPLSTHLASRQPVPMDTSESLGSRALVNLVTGGQVFSCSLAFPEPVPSPSELRLGIRYNLAHQAWVGDVLANERLTECGATKSKRNPETGEAYTYRRSCERYWLCLRCGPAYWADARRRVMGVLDPWLASKRGGFFVTIKTTHTRKTPCRTSMDNLQTVWREITKTHEWREMKEVLNIELTFKATEISLDKQGPHPHIHALMLTTNQPSDKIVDAFEEYLTERFEEISSEKGFGIPEKPVEVKRIRDEEIGHYVTKGSLRTIKFLARQGLSGQYWATNTLNNIAVGTQRVHGATFSKDGVWGSQRYR